MRLLNDICELRRETCSPHDSNSGIYVGLEHIDPGQFFLSRHGSPTQVRSTKSRFYAGDVLYGKLRPYLDKAVVAETGGICSTDILVLEPIEVPSWFLCGIIHSDAFIEHAKQTTYGVNHPRTSWSGIKEFETMTFALLEQKKIAAVLLKIQRAIEMQEKIIQSLRDLKKSTMQYLFTHGLRGEKTKMTKIGEIPESWNVVQLGSIVGIKHGYAFKSQHFTSDGEYILLTPGSFFEEGGFRDEPEKRKYYSGVIPEGFVLEEGDLLVAMTEQKRGLLGSSLIVPESGKYLHNQRLGLVQTRVQSKLSTGFLSHLFNTSRIRQRIEFSATGMKVRHTAPSRILELSIPLPALEEQSDIASAIDALNSKLLAHESKKAVLQDLFKTTLNKLMTGEIRVSDLDIDVREVEV
ncbi:MAG TPA: restriction endonuclease subunit S [Candidatus Acetothermia bacterium]|nr:restriction endonuclease subunit S [Candidatus Acetothermia bacterium]